MGAPITVLIAEDHGVVRDGTRRILEEQNDLAVVAEVSTGEDAVEEGRRTRPDVAILDIHLPGMSGVEATRLLAQAAPDTRVLILSAYDDDDYVFALMDAGAMGYLLKTARAEEVVEAVRSVARGEVVLHPTIERKIARFWLQKRTAGGGADESEKTEALTQREMEVLRLVAQGLRNKEVADILNVSTRTVEGHLNNIYTKLGVSSRTEAIIFGVNQHWFGFAEGSEAR